MIFAKAVSSTEIQYKSGFCITFISKLSLFPFLKSKELKLLLIAYKIFKFILLEISSEVSWLSSIKSKPKLVAPLRSILIKLQLYKWATSKLILLLKSIIVRGFLPQVNFFKAILALTSKAVKLLFEQRNSVKLIQLSRIKESS